VAECGLFLACQLPSYQIVVHELDVLGDLIATLLICVVVQTVACGLLVAEVLVFVGL
jgi:hypothetical protein